MKKTEFIGFAEDGLGGNKKGSAESLAHGEE